MVPPQPHQIQCTYAYFLLPQAQGEALIRKALTELKLWALQRMFTFTSNSEKAAAGGQAASAATTKQGSGRVPLVKEWSDILSELGNHQSLVASLKTSHYYSMFKVNKLSKSLSYTVSLILHIWQSDSSWLSVIWQASMQKWSLNDAIPTGHFSFGHAGICCRSAN